MQTSTIIPYILSWLVVFVAFHTVNLADALYEPMLEFYTQLLPYSPYFLQQKHVAGKYLWLISCIPVC